MFLSDTRGAARLWRWRLSCLLPCRRRSPSWLCHRVSLALWVSSATMVNLAMTSVDRVVEIWRKVKFSCRAASLLLIYYRCQLLMMMKLLWYEIVSLLNIYFFLHFLRETLLLAVIVAHRLKQDDDFPRSDFSFVALLNRSLS